MLNDEMKDADTPGFILQHTFHRGTEIIHRVAWSPDGKLLAIAYQKEIIEIRDLISDKLTHTLRVKKANYSIAWSPDGEMLAVGQRACLSLWQIKTGELRFTLKLAANKIIKSLAWSPDGAFLASGSNDSIIRLWRPENKQPIYEFTEHFGDINCLAWSPDGHILASGSDDNIIYFWDLETKQLLEKLSGHRSPVNSLVWSKDGEVLASASNDKVIIWHVGNRVVVKELDIHAEDINSLDLSYDGKFLASKSSEGTIYIWDFNTGESVKTLKNTKYGHYANLAFRPEQPGLAIPGKGDRTFHVLDLNIDTILSHIATPTYVSARVVLLGDQGAGKSSLALALRNQPHVSPEATHTSSIEKISTREVVLDNGSKETRDIFLWDLAELEYHQFIHQIYGDEPNLALILFNVHSNLDPFVGIQYWEQALGFMWSGQQSNQGLQNVSSFMKKILVATHIDLGEKRHIRQSCREMIKEQRFDKYVEVSSTRSIKIEALRKYIEMDAIDWRTLPKLPFTRLFQSIQNFILKLKKDEHGQGVFTSEQLLQGFLDTRDEFFYFEELRAEFSTCVNKMESQGLVKKFQYGDFILLRPEKWDHYISALMRAAIDENEDGSGSILEEKVLNGAFYISAEQRFNDKRLERLLLTEIVAYLLYNDVVLRETSRNSSYLVFPSLATREQANIMEGCKQLLIIHFQGPIDNLYAKLVIQLSHSFFFRKKDIGKNFAIFIPNENEKENICGIYLNRNSRLNGHLTLFFGKNMNNRNISLFGEHIYNYFLSHAWKESTRREYIYTCSNCQETFPHSMILHRRYLGFNIIRCSVCETSVSIEEEGRDSLSAHRLDIFNAEQAIKTKRNEELEKTNLYSKSLGKIVKGDFDVFLCYNPNDKSTVKKIREQLMGKGVAPWFDEEDSRPGLLHTASIEAQIEAAKSVAFFVGREGMTPWQRFEYYTLLQTLVNQGRPVIPVLLEGAPDESQLPPFLRVFRSVNFSSSVPPAYLPRKIISSRLLDEEEERVVAESEEYDQNDDWRVFLGEERSSEQISKSIDLLIWGITGEKPKSPE